MRMLKLAAILFVLAVTGAHAAGAPKASDGDKVGQYVDINQVAAPILAEGRLVNYVFIQVRLNLAPGVDTAKVRDKEPYLRDALVRTVHRTSLTAKTDYLHVDEALLKSAVTRDVSPLIGARSVTSVQILKQAPKQQTGVPRPKA